MARINTRRQRTDLQLVRLGARNGVRAGRWPARDRYFDSSRITIRRAQASSRERMHTRAADVVGLQDFATRVVNLRHA
jgi:hypothetical protein